MDDIEEILTRIPYSPGTETLRKALNDAYQLGWDAKTSKLEKLLDACMADNSDAIARALEELKQ